MLRWLVLGCFVLFSWRCAAHAQIAPAAVDGEAIEPKLHAAVRAYDSGQLDQARRLFEEVHARQPTARTLRGLGVIAFRQGRCVEAVVLLEASLSSREKPLTRELARSVEVVLADARKQLSRVRLTGLGEGAQVLVDGAESPRDGQGALLLSAGAHALVISRPGYDPRRHEIAIQAGGELTLDATLTPVTVAAPEIPTPPAQSAARPAQPPARKHPDAAGPVEPTRSPRTHRLRRASYGLLGVGAGALLTSLAATAAGIKRVGEIEARCRAQEGCSQERAREFAREDNLSLLSGLSIGGVVVGGVSAVAGGVLWLTLSRADRGPGVSPDRASVLLQLGGAF